MCACDHLGENSARKATTWLKKVIKSLDLGWHGLWDNCFRAQMRSDQQKAFLGLKPPWATVMPEAADSLLAKKTSSVFKLSPDDQARYGFDSLDKTPLPPSQFLLIICKSSFPNIPYVGLSALLRNQGTCSESSKRFVSLPSPLLCCKIQFCFFFF